jgi:hypothetical protein
MTSCKPFLTENISVDTLLTVVAEDAKYWVDCNLATDDLGVRSCVKRVLTHLGLELEVVTEEEFRLLWDMVESEFRWRASVRHAKLKEVNS